MPYLSSPARFLFHYVAARPIGFLLLTVIVVAASASQVGVQYAMKLLIDAMTASTHALSPVEWALGAFIGLVALESLLLRASAMLLCRNTVASGVRIRLDMFDYLSGHQLAFFQNQRAGSLGHRVGALTGSFSALTHRILMEITPPLIAFIGALIIFWTIDPMMAIVLALVFVSASVLLVTLGLRGDKYHKEFARRASDAGGELVDLMSNIWSVKAFGARRREMARLRNIFDQEASAQRRGWFFVERIRSLHDVALIILVSGTMVWSVLRWSSGLLTPGDVVVVSAMTFRMLNGSRDLAMALIDTSQQFSYLGETLDIVGVPHALQDAPGARPLVPAEGAVRIENLSFGYDPHRPVLHDISIDIPAGQKVGIVGPSGAGKSTILQLVQRMYDPQSGCVLVDGQEIDKVTQDSLHSAVAVVPQEVLLFHRSVMENIRFARPDASDEEVRRAAEAARCDEFIRAMPEGYDSIVGERGTNLSGGQRQRIGIARALLCGTRIVLLDEATSALDTESEVQVQEGLAALMTDHTVLAVAHRLSTVVTFDRILVIENGRVVEDGPPMQLLRDGGAFRRLWALQAEGLEQPIEEEAAPILSNVTRLLPASWSRTEPPRLVRPRAARGAGSRWRTTFGWQAKGE